MTIDQWIRTSPFIKRMMRVFNVDRLRLDVKVRWPLKEKQRELYAKYVYRNKTHWIYSASSKRNSIIHELLHALRRSTKTSTNVGEYGYDYDPEEYEALWWEIRYLRSIGRSKERIVRQMMRETLYPREFINTLWETKLGQMRW